MTDGDKPNHAIRSFEKLWEDHPVRFQKEPDGVFVPIVDLAAATGLQKKSFFQTLDRNTDVFSPHERGVHLNTPGGRQYTRCIDRDGCLMLLTKISTNSIKNKDTRTKLIEFQSWMGKLMGEGVDRKGDKINLSPPSPPIKRAPTTIAREAIKLAKLLSVKQRDVISLMFEHEGYGYLNAIVPATIQEQSKLLLPAPSEPFKVKPYMTPTEIGLLNGSTPRQINQWLYNNAYQIKDSITDEWRLTPLGFKFAKEQVVKFDTGHEGVVIWWTPKILEKMNINVKES